MEIGANKASEGNSQPRVNNNLRSTDGAEISAAAGASVSLQKEPRSDGCKTAATATRRGDETPRPSLPVAAACPSVFHWR